MHRHRDMNGKRWGNADFSQAVNNPPPTPAPFASNDKLVEAAGFMLSSRVPGGEGSEHSESNLNRKAGACARSWANYWHKCIDLTNQGKATLALRLNEEKLTHIEREIIMVLVLSHLGIIRQNLTTPTEILAAIQITPSGLLRALRAMSEHGRLLRRGLIVYQDPDEDLRDRDLLLNPELISMLLANGIRKEEASLIQSEEDCVQTIIKLRAALESRSHTLYHFQQQEQRDLHRLNFRISRLWHGLRQAVAQNPDWSIYPICGNDSALTETEALMVLYLVGAEYDLFSSGPNPTGNMLARACSESVEEARQAISSLAPEGNLVKLHMIQPAGGMTDGILSADARALAEEEYELAETGLKLLKTEKEQARRTPRNYTARTPKVQLSKLVLNDATSRALKMAAAQVRNAETMLRDWGLQEIVPYGRGVTLLFSGPPGTGKTACAEALAHMLGRPILVADYSQILNCYVGGTPKNISRTFREARTQNAVLFWDEADAMFYNRERAERNWEVQDSNVLLSELEKFEGVCILATNRKLALDPALERRITLKVEFPRPDRSMRRELWKQMLPAALQSTGQFDFDQLSQHDLSGGEIKNVLLNAARLALSSENQLLSHIHLEEAIHMELETRWRQTGTHAIGFERGRN